MYTPSVPPVFMVTSIERQPLSKSQFQIENLYLLIERRWQLTSSTVIYSHDLILYILSMDEVHLARTKCDPNVLDDPYSTHLRPSGTMELSIYREYNYIYLYDMWTHYNMCIQEMLCTVLAFQITTLCTDQSTILHSAHQ